MSRDQYPAVEYVRQCFREENGRLFWLVRPRGHFATLQGCATSNARFANQEAGYPSLDSRVRVSRWKVCVGGCNIYRHIIIWALHHGEWPCGDLDHKNRDTLDDRIENLRAATKSQNCANRVVRSDSTSGVKGVNWDKKRSRWCVHISVKGKRRRVGRFTDIEDAKTAYAAAAARHFGEFACSGDRAG